MRLTSLISNKLAMKRIVLATIPWNALLGFVLLMLSLGICPLVCVVFSGAPVNVVGKCLAFTTILFSGFFASCCRARIGLSVNTQGLTYKTTNTPWQILGGIKVINTKWSDILLLTPLELGSDTESEQKYKALDVRVCRRLINQKNPLDSSDGISPRPSSQLTIGEPGWEWTQAGLEFHQLCHDESAIEKWKQRWFDHDIDKVDPSVS